jgi:site-specific recombinase XerD
LQQSRAVPRRSLDPIRTRPTRILALSGCLESFLRSRKALDRSPRTVEEYRLACRAFSAFLTDRYGDDDAQRVGRRDIEDFLIDYQATHSSTTANKTFRGLRALFNWLWREEEMAPLRVDSPGR